MQLEERFRFVERAELLGAIYGDGCIEQRSRRGQKVSVAVSDEWPQWFARVPQLFDAVFGRWWRRRKKRKKGLPNERRVGVKNYEFYLTTHDLPAIFDITAKYDADGRLVPPAWVEADERYLRAFLLGLVATDGCFSFCKERLRFQLSQTNDHLSAWFVETLRRLGYQANTCFNEDAGVNQPTIDQETDVRRFGEWLQSEKWIAIRDGNWAPKPSVINRKSGGTAVVPGRRVILKTISTEEQERWREWRTRGASCLAIARHVGRSTNAVWMAVRDIVPTTTRSAEALGLKPRPAYPKNAVVEMIEGWRASAMRGESSRHIAARTGVRYSVIADATADIRWEQQIKKRQVEAQRLARMRSEPQGNGRWNDWSPPAAEEDEEE